MALMAEKEKAELRFYQKTWFNIPLIIGSVVVALALRRLGLFEEDGGLFTLSAIAFALFAVCTLPFPRLCPWMHRRMRIAFKLDDPEQKRKAGLLDD